MVYKRPFLNVQCHELMKRSIENKIDFRIGSLNDSASEEKESRSMSLFLHDPVVH